MGCAKLMVGKLFQGNRTQLGGDILDELKQKLQQYNLIVDSQENGRYTARRTSDPEGIQRYTINFLKLATHIPQGGLDDPDWNTYEVCVGQMFSRTYGVENYAGNTKIDSSKLEDMLKEVRVDIPDAQSYLIAQKYLE